MVVDLRLRDFGRARKDAVGVPGHLKSEPLTPREPVNRRNLTRPTLKLRSEPPAVDKKAGLDCFSYQVRHELSCFVVLSSFMSFIDVTDGAEL